MIFAYGRSGSALGPYVTGPWQKQSQRVLFTDFFCLAKNVRIHQAEFRVWLNRKKVTKKATVTFFSKTATTSHPNSYKEEQPAT